MDFWKAEEIMKTRAFTLLEIAFALVLLSGSLVIIVGLQSSNINRAISDRNQQQASLVARSILSAIEVDPNNVGEQSTEEPADQLLQKLIPTDESKEEKQNQNNFMANLNVQIIEMPIPPDSIINLKKVELSIYSKDEFSKPFEIVYFLPVNPQPGER